MLDLNDRGQFLNLAGLTEGSLVVLAFFLGWVAQIDPWVFLRWNWEALAWGILGTIPIFILFLISQYFAGGPFLRIKRFLVEMLGPSLAACRWYDLILLAALAGFSEELLFRGILQPWFDRIGPGAGLIGSNILFGLAHSITALYALLAGLVGIYLGVLLDVTGDSNLLVPMTTHALYDYLAFLVIIRTYNMEQAEIRERQDSSSHDEEMNTESKESM